MDAMRGRLRDQLECLREDHKRPLNPTPYKVSLSERLFEFMHKLWLDSAVMRDLS
jgi:nicotinate phosphoribosyltransferase